MLLTKYLIAKYNIDSRSDYFQLKVERYHREKVLPQLEKTKFLVPDSITMSQFLVIIRNKIKLSPTQVSTYINLL